MPKWLDLPPVWLAVFVGIAWCQAAYLPLGLGFGGAWSLYVGGAFVAGGLLLILLAAVEFRRNRTTIIPHQPPSNLIISGIYRLSRNPIYLADVLILTGLILRWDAVLSLPLIPVCVWILQNRFITREENLMRQAFGAGFASYEANVRRWM